MINLNNEELISYLQSTLVEAAHKTECYADSGLTRAAILVPLVFKENFWQLLYIHRSDAGEFHKGEVAFPGGSREKSDRDDVDTAIRETQEELGIKEKRIHVMGRLPSASTVTNFCVTPVVAKLEWPIDLTINKTEVERVFTIPLDWLIQSDHWHYQDFLSPSRGLVKTIFYEPYDGEVLWGFSAKITHQLIEIFK